MQQEENIPTPSAELVSASLVERNKIEDYILQERALNKLFHELCPDNHYIENILLKCSCLNYFYSTQIFSIFHVAQNIFSLEDVDTRLKQGDLSLVSEIQRVTIDDKVRKFYSFATKYCCHHNANAFPIYDSYIDKTLRYFKKIDSFTTFENEDLREYAQYVEILNLFKKYYDIESFTIRDVDWFLWQFGKKHFPNNYGKKKK